MMATEPPALTWVLIFMVFLLWFLRRASLGDDGDGAAGLDLGLDVHVRVG